MRIAPLTLCLASIALAAPKAPAPKPEPAPAAPAWLGAQLPLQLAVKTPEDLAFKSAAEREYLIFNLLTGGKVAWDKGDFTAAADAWESLLRTPGVSAELDALVRPLAKAARERAAGAPATVLPLPEIAALRTTEVEPPPKAESRPSTPTVTVLGTVSGGGTHGPGGAVILLHRADGPTPKPRAVRVQSVKQQDKRFTPRLLAVPLGSTVVFENLDEVFHNVFSLSKPNDFDLGLYQAGTLKERKFDAPGPVELLCNIHSSMQGTIYVADTPWFTQANGAGRFAIKGVPPGNYTLEVWHEFSTRPVSRPLKVAGGMEEVAVAVDGDKRAPTFVPDKSGTPRQVQLGY